MHKTLNGREIHFLGEGRKDIKPINNVYEGIDTLDDCFELLLQCYNKQTAYPLCQNKYNCIINPTSGQCGITSVIIQEIFGGSICKIDVDEQMTHLFNIINGDIIDLTNDQFSFYNIVLDYESNREVKREECLSNQNTRKRYNILKDKMIKQLQRRKQDQER